MITEQNYLRALGGVEGILGQVGRFLQYTKRPSIRILVKLRSDIRSLITEEVRQNRKKMLEQIKEQQQKKTEEQRLRLREQFQKRQKLNNG